MCLQYKEQKIQCSVYLCFVYTKISVHKEDVSGESLFHVCVFILVRHVVNAIESVFSEECYYFNLSHFPMPLDNYKIYGHAGC